MTQDVQTLHAMQPNKNPKTPSTFYTKTLALLRPSQRLLLHRLLKHLQRQRRLVKRHLVPGPKHPQEAQVVDRLERAALGAVDRVGGQGLGRKGRRAGVGDCVGGREAAEPVADPVGVAGPDADADAALDDGGEGGEEVAGIWRKEMFVSWGFCRRGKVSGLTVACGGELVVGGVWTLGICCFGTDCTRDRRLVQVVDVGLWWVGVVAWSTNVVYIKVVRCDTAVCRGSAEGTLNVAVAGVVGILTGCI